MTVNKKEINITQADIGDIIEFCGRRYIKTDGYQAGAHLCIDLSDGTSRYFDYYD